MKLGIVGALIVVMMGAGSYLAPRPWRIVCLVLLVLTVVAWERFRQRRQLVTTLRRIRHRQANDVQVIQGWTQLGRMDRTGECLDRISNRLGEEARWYRDLPLSWLYTVLILDIYAESRGVQCQWQISRTPSAWLRLLRFHGSVASAIRSAGSTVDVHLDANSFVVSLPGPRGIPRAPWGVKRWQQGDTIVLIWQARARKSRAPSIPS